MKLNFHDRPLSWSAISSFRYDPEQWYAKYIMGEPTIENEEMRFGKKIGKKLETDPTFMPEIPRHCKMEHPFHVKYNGMDLVGYCDSFCTKTNKKLLEYKTGKHGAYEWNRKKVNEHGQLTMYCLMNYITNKVRPEDMEIELIWMPTKKTEDGNFEVKIEFDGPIQRFKAKRTMRDILKFAKEIDETVRDMELYVRSREDFVRGA